ncbi:MAG TPA: cell division protein FtsA [Oceanipulchritudo sp.]|nr:cell division protein FtsA [Oceanipulchritudo sp.]
MSRSKIVGAIEIGTSKVVVLVAEMTDGRSMNIIGRGQSTTVGMKKGEVIDLSSVSDCAHAAIMSAEKLAGTEIEHVYLSLSGSHLRGFRHAGATAITGSGNIVTAIDVQRAVENARSKVLEPGQVYIHHIRNGFLLDGKPVESPVSRQGSHLEVQYWHVVADEQKVKDHIMVVNGFGLDVNDIVISSLASGSLLATDEEKRQGVMVVDIGKGTTDYVLYRGRRVVHTGVIPVGGDHITNDLSLGLRVKSKLAENLKVRAARAMVQKEDRNEKVPLVGDLSIGDSFHSQLSINKITHARLEELFIILKNRLGSLLTRQNIPCGVILTGGVSKTPLIADLGEVTLDVPVTIGQSPDWVRHSELREPEYANVLGLLYNALHDQKEEGSKKTTAQKRWLSKMTGLFG